ncbi:MAG TPA: restriction endonuclease subunit S [Candidatus Peribacterales bacterium]|nr:restriction endonuclease subunit S [Candidatus Peribacterales bacterium]
MIGDLLPTGWQMRKVGDLAVILNGYAFKSKNYVNTGVRVIRITNVQKGEIVDDDPKFYPSDSREPIKKYQLNENDLLMSLTGNVGRVGLIQRDFLPAALNQRVACIRVSSERLDKQFLFHFLNRREFEEDCIRSAKGVAQKNMSTVWLEKYEIPLPPLPTQRKIVEILDAADALRKKRREADEKMKGLIPALFVKMFGDPATNPMGWEMKELQELGEVFSGATPSTKEKEYWDGGINWVTPAELSDDSFIINESQRKITQKGYESCSAKIFPSGTVLLSCRAPIGKVAIAGTEMCTNQGFKSLNPNGNEMHSHYLFWWLKQQNSYLQTLGAGATFKEISGARFKKIKIPAPNIQLQREFASFVDNLSRTHNTASVQSKNISQLFDVLLHKAFRGELVT